MELQVRCLFSDAYKYMIGNWEPSADALNRKKKIEGWENNLEIILENDKYLRPNKIHLKSFITFWTYRQIIFFQQADTGGVSLSDIQREESK